MREKIQKLIAQMTLEEKASLCSGLDNWHTKPIPRLEIPSIMMCDGPHGLRKQEEETDHLGLNEAVEAVCFPTASASACSFDRELLREIGQALGDECQAEDVALILGPGANIKRSPLCGRNFEYFSEDPYQSSQMAAAFIEGVQSRGVGTSLKHFLANNQESRRMSVSADVSSRTLREIYLASFEEAVKKSQPATVMCSYNRLNGVYLSEDPFALTQVLRDEWGFEGFVVSDWGAVNDRVEGLKAGLDLEMPSSGGVNDEVIVQAVQDGKLDMAVLDRAAARILELVLGWQEKKTGVPYDKEAHHALSRRAAGESMVLLKNSGVLPLDRSKKLAFIGEFAMQPRYQGSGSSHINSFRVESARDALSGMDNVSFAAGFSSVDAAANETLLQEAVALAASADVAVIFAGLPDADESEGFDRKRLDMPACQNRLIEEIAAVQPNVVVVLHNGAPVVMPWLHKVSAVLEAYLGGQAVGAAVCDVLFGDVNPSGKLAETFPLKLSDNPSYLNFPGEGDEVNYAEGIFVGYRYYDKKEMDVLFPFGHGLSYTGFEYTGISLSSAEIEDTEMLTVTVKLKNTGSRFGKEVVQLYVADCESGVIRPIRELKGFEKIALEAGAEGSVSFTLDKRAFAFWDESLGDWRVESGTFDILVGGSSRDLPLKAAVKVTGTTKARIHFHLNSTLGEVLKTEIGKEVLAQRLEDFINSVGAGDASMGEAGRAMMESMIADLPLRGLIGFSKGEVSREMLQMLVDALNAE